TSAVLTISTWMTNNLTTLTFLGIAAIAFIITTIYSDKLRGLCKRFLYKIKVVNELMTKIAIERFTTNLYNLLESSVPILDALKLSKKTLNHPFLEKDVENIIHLVEKGQKFSHAIKSSSHFPPLVSKMISTGEHAGTISPILQHLSELFHQEVKTALEKFTALLQPILLLLIGIIVGVVLLAVLIPLTDVSSLI
ncbi:type II secretion system F family protein, partial [bacterium]|nr:type II secretion system F family protein [bacterium]